MVKKNKTWTLDLFLEEANKPKKKDLHIRIPLNEKEVEYLKHSESAYRIFKSEMKALLDDVLDKMFEK